MKIAVLSESPADEAAIKILVQAVLGDVCQFVEIGFQPPGWPGVRTVLPEVLKYLYYRTDVEGLIVVADSNGTPIHEPAHDRTAGGFQKCRLCQLCRVAADVTSQFRSGAGKSPIKTTVGLAVPAVEAWYLCGVRVGVTEAAWRQELDGGTDSVTRKNQLKEWAYGNDRVGLASLTQHAVGHAT